MTNRRGFGLFGVGRGSLFGLVFSHWCLVLPKVRHAWWSSGGSENDAETDVSYCLCWVQ